LFNNRQEFISAAASEKITLATVEAKKRLYVFSGPTTNVYSKIVPNFVAQLKQDDQALVQMSSENLTIDGTFYYDIKTSTLYARFYGDIDPKSAEIIATYRLFYSTKGLQTSNSLENVAEEVHWEGRILSSPGYKHKIGIGQSLTSLIGEGTLALANSDGEIDNIFDQYIFENQSVVVYSWNTDLDPSESRVIYRGSITNKSYNGNNVTFKIKDQTFALLDSPQLQPYTNDDNVADSVKGRYKRRVYGRVDGLRAQALDQIANGIQLTGTGFMGANTNVLIGTGTSFLTEVVQNDTIVVGTQEFSVDSVDSDTQITVGDEADFSFSGQQLLLRSERGRSLKNRTFLGAAHVCAEVTYQVVEALQFNRIQLSGTEGLIDGDFVEFSDTGERVEIKNVAPNNIVVLQQNVVLKPGVGTDVVRRPVQEVYIGSRKVNSDDFTVFNTSSGCGITFDSDTEFNLSQTKNSPLSGTFTNGSREITVSTTEVSLQDSFTAGDFVKPNFTTYSTFYKITHVTDSSLFLSENFVDPTISDTIEIKSPDYLNDESVVSLNILGKTEDGTASGVWITTAGQASKDLIAEVGITNVNTQSFIDGTEDASQLISMAIPFSFDSKSIPNVKTLTDALNKSVHSSLTLDNQLLIKYQVLNVYTDENLPVIRDHDVIDWKVSTTNGKTYKKALVKYRHTDIDLSTLQDGNAFIEFDSQFVERYIGTNKVDELDIYLYEDRDAEISAHRHLYYNSLSVSTLTVKSDLRLENSEIGDVVIMDFRRLYRRKGDNVRKKVMLITGKTIDGEKTQFEMSDLGNTFNTSSYITPNDAPDWIAADEDQKLIYGYITDNQGIVNDEEDTTGTHLIS